MVDPTGRTLFMAAAMDSLDVLFSRDREFDFISATGSPGPLDLVCYLDLYGEDDECQFLSLEGSGKNPENFKLDQVVLSGGANRDVVCFS